MTKTNPCKWEEELREKHFNKLAYIGKSGEEHVDKILASIHKIIIKERAKYQELIMAIENKYKGETRHETALRLIKNSQKSSIGCKKDPNFIHKEEQEYYKNLKEVE